MDHRLSPRESRRLVRRFLRLDERGPGVAVIYAAGIRPAGEGSRPGSAPVHANLGPYETDYEVAEGYSEDRTIIRP